MKRNFAVLGILLFFALSSLSACENTAVSENVSKNEEQITEENTEQAPNAVPEEKNGTLYINFKDKIEIDENIILAPVNIRELLNGKPMMYARRRADGWIFEWVRSDYHDPDKEFLPDESVLIISSEENKESKPIIHKMEELPLLHANSDLADENKLIYKDVNFDGISDLLVGRMDNGSERRWHYSCFLQTDDSFEYNESFGFIGDPYMNKAAEKIKSTSRYSALSHVWEFYEYRNGEFVKISEFAEEAVADENGIKKDENGKEVWRYLLDGKEIGRSDEMTETEQHELFYNTDIGWGVYSNEWEPLFLI